ncbi:hypothetical protein KY385_02945 [Candidatus Parcubacteria bacterium]|nr:hypothetical protein [Candidatus Parcubacteria bacterium]
MNIYLDIDGVLLINENQAAPFADEFLQYILTNYPNSTYWLTTHCWRGENRAVEILTPVLKEKTLKMLSIIKPTEWGNYKTDAIDFSQPFLWFDDDLFPEEEVILQQNNASGSQVRVNLYKDPNQLQKILDSFPVR